MHKHILILLLTIVVTVVSNPGTLPLEYGLLPPNRTDETIMFSFGIVADIQYADQKINSNRYYTLSPYKLRQAINYFNNDNTIRCIVNLGDATDKKAHFYRPVVQNHFKRSNHPFHHVLGDHDYYGVRDLENVYKDFHMPAPYYVVPFTEHNTAFIVLNTNEISLFSTNNPMIHEEARSYIAKLRRKKARNYHPFNAALSSDQLLWLRKTIQETCATHKHVLVFGHHPLRPAHYEVNLWNDNEVVELLTSEGCVRVVFSGHAHLLRHDVVIVNGRGVHFVTFPGMVQFSNSSYGVVDITPEGVIIVRVLWWGRVGWLRLYKDGRWEVPPAWKQIFEREQRSLEIKLERIHGKKIRTSSSVRQEYATSRNLTSANISVQMNVIVAKEITDDLIAPLDKGIPVDFSGGDVRTLLPLGISGILIFFVLRLGVLRKCLK